ncbi:hypothetical protein ABPG72_015290 [Tetrahymena utriculariae]
MFPKLSINGNKSCINLNSPSVSPNLIALKNQLLISPAIFNANNSFYKNNNNQNLNIFSKDFNDSFYNSKNRWVVNQIDNSTNKILNSFKKDVKKKLHTTEDIQQLTRNTESDQRMKNSSHTRKIILVKSVEVTDPLIFNNNNNSQLQEISNLNNQQFVQQQNNPVNNIVSLNKSRPLKKKVFRISINDGAQYQDKFQLVDQSNQSEHSSPQLLSVNSDSVRLRKSSFQGFAISASPLNQNSSLTSFSSVKQISQSSVFSNRSNSSKQTQCSIQYIPNDIEKDIQNSPFLNPYLEDEESQCKSSEQIKRALDKSLISEPAFEDQIQRININSPLKTPDSSEKNSQSRLEEDQGYQSFYNFLYSDKQKQKKRTSIKGILKSAFPKQFDVIQSRIIQKRVSFSQVKEYF